LPFTQFWREAQASKPFVVDDRWRDDACEHSVILCEKEAAGRLHLAWLLKVFLVARDGLVGLRERVQGDGGRIVDCLVH
jgi:hypothetical protein